MTRILVVSFPYDKKTAGGAAKSFVNIIHGLNKHQNIEIKLLSMAFPPRLNRMFHNYGIGYFFYLPKILKAINRFKPNIIFTQTGWAFVSIIAARLKGIPIINIIRDISLFCPKHVDIIAFGKACPGLKSRKICFTCMDYWRSLRVLIGNKPINWQYSLRAALNSIGYKFRYFTCKINLKILNLSSINVVASELMRLRLIQNVKPHKVSVVNITPVKKVRLPNLNSKTDQLLMLIPSFEASHKGLNFILKLSSYLPEGFVIIIAGKKLTKSQLQGLEKKIINLDQIFGIELEKLYQCSKITLMPTFCTEAFGRVIIESIINKTPVISSPNCGANAFFKDKEFVKVIPLKLGLWAKAIDEIINNPPEITNQDIEDIYSLFSIDKNENDFLKLINKLTR